MTVVGAAQGYLVPTVIEQTSRASGGTTCTHVFSRNGSSSWGPDRRHRRQPDLRPDALPRVRGPGQGHLAVRELAGGDITALFAIYDTMKFVKPDVSTFCFGQAASAAAVLLAAGAHGKRFALPHARILLHQPWGGRPDRRVTSNCRPRRSSACGPPQFDAFRGHGAGGRQDRP